MPTFIPGSPSTKRRRAAMQAALYHQRDRDLRDTTLIDDKASLAWGSIVFSANPSNGATITLGGTVVTFGTDVTIGGDLPTTLVHLLAFLSASANANIVKCTYTVSATGLGIRAKAPGVATFTLAASAATVSHSTLKLVQVEQRAAL